MISIVFFSVGCSDAVPAEEAVTLEEELQAEDKNRVFGEVSDTAAAMSSEVDIEGVGTFAFNLGNIETIRDDIFKDGYFSIFDVLVHLEQSGQIEMDYYFDQEMNTYVIDSLGGHNNWWYDAYYDGGWREKSVFRMDLYPYKDEMTLRFVHASEEQLELIYDTYRDEVSRLNENDGKIIVPEVIIEGKNENLTFENVEIKAHNLRDEMFQPGVITAIDTILSLADEGDISYDLQWHESIGTAGVVKSYWVERINDDVGEGRCGFVYEAGNENFRFFHGNHIHIPSDIRVISSPQYVKYFWICI
ncbi:MAG: hypothetical protein ACQES4_12995 [Bacillota bacterium]